MARLTAWQRSVLGKEQFLGPGRTFPGNDAEHLRKAIQLAPRSAAAGNISEETAKRIQAKARARLAAKYGGGSSGSSGS